MSERIDPSALVGTWTQVRPADLAVLIFSSDGGFELEVGTPDLAGQPIRSCAVGGDWGLVGDRLRTTLRSVTPNSWAESIVEYRVIECWERLRLRDLEDEAAEVMEFERVSPR
jgi:hypothetical protein